MHDSWVPIALLTLLLGRGLTSQRAVASNQTPSRSAKPRVVATVMSLGLRGLAAIQTVDGARYQVLQGTGWQVGDTVECAQYDVRTPETQVQLDCWKVS
jgi:hypothetical protein